MWRASVKIAVCIKRVIDMETRFRIAGDGASVDEGGAKFDVNDFDMYAIEAALQLRDKAGAGEVVAISLGPLAAQEQIRKALSMGADRGIHLAAEKVPSDGLAIASALAAEIRSGAYDLVLFGKMSIDSSSQAVGPMVAELLDMPLVTAVSKIDVDTAKGTAGRTIEGGTETISFPLPAVLTIDEGLNTPRLPNLKGIMAAKKKPLESRPAQLGDARVMPTRVELPADRPPGRIIGEGPAAVPELIRLLQTEAKVL
jgi:electron transfer flavoprotein beta subunit